MEGNLTPNNVTNVSVSSSSLHSQWLKKIIKQRYSGCRSRPWVCRGGEIPSRSMCCGNRCVNVTSDNNNCGFCRSRCPFNWQCCKGLCRDINISIFNCGKCGHRCPFGELCYFGMCGYGGTSPFPPKPPKIPYLPPYPPSPPDAPKEEF
ncbi:hypothetical protein RYX36_016449 [Vicia faba]